MNEQTPEPKKKSRVLIWVLAGCGGIIIIGIIIFALLTFFVAKKVKDFADNPEIAVAKMIAASDPDVDIKEIDEEKGKITFVNKKTGETITMDLSEVREGRIQFKSDDGEEISFDARGEGEKGSVNIQSERGRISIGEGSTKDLPSWLPVYPGSDPQASYSSTMDEGVSGGFQFQTTDSADLIVQFYEEKLKKKGFKVNTSSYKQDGKLAGGFVGAETDDGVKTVTVNFSVEKLTTTVMVAYQEKKVI